jgi:hypothetical protein
METTTTTKEDISDIYRLALFMLFGVLFLLPLLPLLLTLSLHFNGRHKMQERIQEIRLEWQCESTIRFWMLPKYDSLYSPDVLSGSGRDAG